MERDILVCNSGKWGDFLFCLPVASWLARERHCKIHFVLPDNFHPFRYAKPLLMLQPFVSNVSVVPFAVQNWECGGQPAFWDPRPFVPGSEDSEYYALGFGGYPTKYISAFFAEKYGIDYDLGFRIQLHNEYCPCEDFRPGTPLDRLNCTCGMMPTDEILRSTEGAMARLVPHATPMGTHEDLLTLARRMAAAKEVHLWMCGLAILNAMAGTRVTVHRVPGHAQISLYYEPDQYLGSNAYITFIEHQEDEIR